MFNPDLPFNDLPDLPPQGELESTVVLKAAIDASRALAELKGRGDLIPNQNILLNVLTLQEAKLSSEIEGIVTTTDQLYRALSLSSSSEENPHAKEVLRYRDALWHGVNKMREDYPLSTNLYVEMVQIIKGHANGIRKGSGTKLQDQRTEKIVYTPPEGEDLLRAKLHKLDEFIHADNGIDPLVKLALIHYQFEAIHPFSDGNGRTGRILNILYLLHQKLLTEPVLYLSRYIISHKGDYYRLLKEVTENGAWEPWILFMLKAIHSTSQHTLHQIIAIHQLMNDYADRVREKLPQVYSKELVEILFELPYCKSKFLVDSQIVKRQTASKYLNLLSEHNFLEPVKMGRETFFINREFFDLLSKPYVDGIDEPK